MKTLKTGNILHGQSQSTWKVPKLGLLWRSVRISVLLAPFLFLLGCSGRSGRAFDAFLNSNRVDRIEIVDDQHDHTNVLSGEAAAHLLNRFAETNRRADPLWHKSYISGYIWFCSGGERIGALAYFPQEQILSYRGYEFSFKDTNDLASLFK
jgi:hypothetical protein